MADFLDGVQDAIQTKVQFVAYDSIEKKKIDPQKGLEQFRKSKDEYIVKINPSSISIAKSISYDDIKSLGSNAALGNFQRVNPEKITIDILLDGTGAVGMLNIVDDVTTEIDKLENVVYKYDGDIHETRFVGIIWGSTNFFGRLTNLDYTHTMFKPSGKPLRTKVKMSFLSSMSLSMQAKTIGLNSPDMSHMVTVIAGDTLPTMCERIYKASHYYLQVARINNLTDFRNLEPGTTLLFPPIKK